MYGPGSQGSDQAQRTLSAEQGKSRQYNQLCVGKGEQKGHLSWILKYAQELAGLEEARHGRCLRAQMWFKVTSWMLKIKEQN